MDLDEQLRDDGVIVLRPSGRIDHQTAPDFDAAMAPFMEQCTQGKGDLVIDLTRTEYMSSAGLRVLMIAARQIKATSGQIVLCALQPLMHEIIEVSRFNVIFDIYDSVDDALAALRNA